MIIFIFAIFPVILVCHCFTFYPITGDTLYHRPKRVMSFKDYATRYQRYKHFKNGDQNTPEDDVTVVFGKI